MDLSDDPYNELPTLLPDFEPRMAEGWTKVPNELLEKMYRGDLTKQQMRILLAVVRQTFGWQKDRAEISLTRLENLTGMFRNHVIEARRGLEQAGLIRIEGRTRNGNILRVVTDSVTSDLNRYHRSGTSRGTDSVTAISTDSVPHKRKTKENSKKGAGMAAIRPATPRPGSGLNPDQVAKSTAAVEMTRRRQSEGRSIGEILREALNGRPAVSRKGGG